jgi:hypothetical protein
VDVGWIRLSALREQSVRLADGVPRVFADAYLIAALGPHLPPPLSSRTVSRGHRPNRPVRQTHTQREREREREGKRGTHTERDAHSHPCRHTHTCTLTRMHMRAHTHRHRTHMPVHRPCRGCHVPFAAAEAAYQCGVCTSAFCLDCEVFLHDAVHMCPGCAQRA